MSTDAVPWLTLVTVVFEDEAGLRRTVESIDRVPWPFPVQHVVVDGSADPAKAEYSRSIAGGHRTSIVERDDGIYDAMNKGLDAATGEHVLFLNAGDVLHPGLRPELLVAAARLDPDGVQIGYCVEAFGPDRYLNPGRGREERVAHSPQHQATIYPRAYVAAHRFTLDQPITADGLFTRRAIALHGVTFVPTLLSEFALGGVSSNYGSLRRVLARARETGGTSSLRVLGKFLLWRLLPRRRFYRLLASYKYTALRRGSTPALAEAPWVVRRRRAPVL